MKNLKVWWNTRNIDPSEELTEDQMVELMQAVKYESRIRKGLHIFWSALIGICTIVAAIFSVLAYFK